jgi:mannosyltransferase
MRPAPRHARRRELPGWLAWVVVAGLTGASLGLGFFDLTKRSLWLDEGYTWLTAVQNTKTIFAVARLQGWHLVPYYLLIHAMIAMFGDSSFVLRAPSVVAGALSVPLLYALVARLGGRLAGLYACTLFVCSEPLVFWQQNARDYALVVLFTVGSVLALVAGVQNEKVWPLIAWVVVTGIGCYTHPEVLFLVPPELIVAILWARSLRTRLLVGGVAAAGALASLPVLGQALHGVVYQTSPVGPPNYSSATEISSFLASATSSGAPADSLSHALLGITFVVVLIGVAQLASDLVDRGCQPENLGLALGLAWLVLPVLQAWIASETGRPSFLDRYVILSLPACSVVVALVVVRLEPRALGLFGVMYLTIFRAGLLVNSYHYPVDDYRSATKWILADARRGDCITFSSNPGRMLYDYYYKFYAKGGPWPVQVFPLAVDLAPPVVIRYVGLQAPQITYYQSLPFVAQASPYCQRIFVLTSHVGSPTGSAGYRLTYQSYEDLLSNLRHYYRLGPVRSLPGVAVSEWTRVHVAGRP